MTLWWRRDLVLGLLLAALVAVVAGCAGGPQDPGGRRAHPASAAATPTPTTPTRRTPTPAHVRAHEPGATVYGLRMLSRSSGWGWVARRPDGRAVLARTTDGGAVWHPLRLTGECRHPADLPSGKAPGSVWLSATSTQTGSRSVLTVCHSTDSGHDWTPVAHFRVTGNASSPQFVDATHGWLTTVVAYGMHSASDVHLYRTSDGGRHWSEVAASLSGLLGGHSFGGLPQTCGSTIEFISSTTGWDAGGCAQGGSGTRAGVWADDVAVTHDGGARWDRVRLPHPRVGRARAGCLQGEACFFAVLALRPHLIELFAGGPATLGSVVYRSTDGLQWTVEPLPLRTNAVGSFDGTRLLQLSASTPVVYSSDDGGRHWRRLATNLPRPSFDGPYFAGPLTAFAFLLDDRPLYRTDDGGRRWTLVRVRLAR